MAFLIVRLEDVGGSLVDGDRLAGTSEYVRFRTDVPHRVCPLTTTFAGSQFPALELKLVPDGVSDQAKGAGTIRLILKNMAALTQYLAELRGPYGSGHGRDGAHKGLEPRHARLAVRAAGTFSDFVTTTYHKRAGGG